MLQRKIFAGIGLALLLGSSPIYATPFPTLANDVGVCDPNNPQNCIKPDASGNVPVTGTFTATLGGFTPGLTFATLTATASSASVALPAGATVVFQNTGTTAVSCTLGIGSATALVSEILVQPSSSRPVVVGTNTFGACIDQTGSASNLVVLMGGSGLDTGYGGGGGSGGGGAVTLASGAVASGAYSAGSYAAGAVVAGAFVDGWDLTQGAKADAAWVSGSGSVVAILKNIAGGVAGSIVAGSAIIGKVGIDQTTDGTTNGVRLTNGYPAGATPITASATGTTAATTATLAGAAAKTTYICSLSVRANATANTNVTDTVTGVITGTLSRALWVPANTAGLGVDEQIYSPCIPASATNTAIAVVSGAPGAGGVVTVNATGYQQ